MSTAKVFFSLEAIRDAMEDQGGYCVACGEFADNVEPDAKKYTCEACGQATVYGAEEIVLRGWAE